MRLDACTLAMWEFWRERVTTHFPEIARAMLYAPKCRPRRWFPLSIDRVESTLSHLAAVQSTRRYAARHALRAEGAHLAERLRELDALDPPRVGELRCALCDRVERHPCTWSRDPYVATTHGERVTTEAHAEPGRILPTGTALCVRCRGQSTSTSTTPPRRSRRMPPPA